MVQSRIEELEAEIRGHEDVIALLRADNQQLVIHNKELEDKIEELEDEECDCECEHEEGEVYTISFERIIVASEEPAGSLSIPMQDLFNALAEKSKQFAGLNQFIEAINSLLRKTA